MQLTSTLKNLIGGGLLLAAFCAQAGVNVNNGNFYVAYTDFLVPTAGLNIEITRTYNSRSNYVKGWFGVGWSSELEGYLAIGDKGITFFEGGGGNVVKFQAKSAGSWENGLFGLQTIAKIKEGYLLKTAQAKDFWFDNNGRLARVSDRNKNFLELVYTGGQVSMLRDNLNNQIKIKWVNAGGHPRVALMEMGDRKARYEYAKSGDLKRATGIDGVPFEYAYDDEHNMTRIIYQDGADKQMAYNKARDWVTKFKDRDDMVTSYDYYSDKLDPENKFGTTVTRYHEGSSDKDISRFWYEFRRRADGSRYNHRSVTWIRNVVTETLFTECCGTPLMVSQWKGDESKAGENQQWIAASPDKRSTIFEYYPDGLLKKKTGPDGSVTLLTYDDKTRKVSSVVRSGRKLEYHYDARGNLAWAYDVAESRRMDLTYDLKGRITVLKESGLSGSKPTGRLVFFRYNADGQPVEIKEKSGAFEGSIKVAYNANGDVTGIFNSEGRAVASEREVESARRVASTFQNLLDIVQPAGVTLTPEG